MRQQIHPGDRVFELARAAHAESANILNNVSLAGIPPGYAVREVVLVGDLSIAIDTTANGGVSMNSADEALRAVSSLSVNGGGDLLRIQGLSGDQLAAMARIYPPRGKDFYDFAPGQVAPSAGATTQITIGLPILYASSHYPGSEVERWPSELFNKLTATLTTSANSAWVTLGGSGSVTGTWYVYAIAYPASRLILPTPLDLAFPQATANTPLQLLHTTFYHEAIGRYNSAFDGSGFDGGEALSIEIGGMPFYPPEGGGFLNRIERFFKLQELEDIESLTTTTRYTHTDTQRILGGRAELGDEVLRQVPLNVPVFITFQSAANLALRRRRRWSIGLVQQYAELLGLESVTGGQLVDKDGKGKLAGIEGSVLPLDTGLLV